MTKLPDIVQFGPATAVPVLQFNPPSLKFEKMPTSPPVFKNQPVIQFTPSKVSAPERFHMVQFDLPDFPSMIKPDSVYDGDFYKDFAKDLVLKHEKAKEAEELEKNSVPDPIHPGKRVVNIVKYEEMAKASPRNLQVQTDAPAPQPKTIKTANIPIEVIKTQQSDVSSEGAQFGIFDAEAQKELQQMGYDVKEQNAYGLKNDERDLAFLLGAQRGYLLLSEADDIGRLAKQVTTQSSYYVVEQAPVWKMYNQRQKAVAIAEQDTATAQRAKTRKNGMDELSTTSARVAEITIQAPKTTVQYDTEAGIDLAQYSFAYPAIYAFRYPPADLPPQYIAIRKTAGPQAAPPERQNWAFSKESSALQPLFAKRQQDSDFLNRQAANQAREVIIAKDTELYQRIDTESNDETRYLHEFSGETASQPFSEQFLTVEAFKQAADECAAVDQNTAVKKVQRPQQDVAFQLPEISRQTVLPEHAVLEAKGTSAPVLQNVKMQFAEAIKTTRSPIQIAEGTVKLVQKALKQPPKENPNPIVDRKSESDAEQSVPQQIAMIQWYARPQDVPERSEEKTQTQKPEYPASYNDSYESSREFKPLAFRPTKEFLVFASDACEVSGRQQVAQELRPMNNAVSPLDYYQSTRFVKKSKHPAREQEELGFATQETVVKASPNAETQSPAFKEHVVLLPSYIKTFERASDQLDSRIVTFHKKAQEIDPAEDAVIDVHRSPVGCATSTETVAVQQHFPKYKKSSVPEFNSPSRFDAKKAATASETIDFEIYQAYINYYQPFDDDFVSLDAEIKRKQQSELQLNEINALLRSVKGFARNGLPETSFGEIEMPMHDPQRTIYAESPYIDIFTDLTQYITRETARNAGKEKALLNDVQQHVKVVNPKSETFDKEVYQYAGFIAVKKQEHNLFEQQHCALVRKTPEEKQNMESIPVAGVKRVQCAEYQDNDFLGDQAAVYRQDQQISEQMDELATQRLKSQRVQYMGKSYNFVDLKRVLSKYMSQAEVKEEALALQTADVQMLSPQCLNVEAQQIRQQKSEPTEEVESGFAELVGNVRKIANQALSPRKSNTVETLEIQRNTPKQLYTEESQQDIVLSKLKNQRSTKTKEDYPSIVATQPHLRRKAIPEDYSPYMLTAGVENENSVSNPCPADDFAIKKTTRKVDDALKDPPEVFVDFLTRSENSSELRSVKSLSVDQQVLESKVEKLDLLEFQYMNARQQPRGTAKQHEEYADNTFLGVRARYLNVQSVEDPFEILDTCVPMINSQKDTESRFYAQELTTKRRVEQTTKEKSTPESEESSYIAAYALNVDREVIRPPTHQYSSISDYEPYQCNVRAERAIQQIFNQVPVNRRAKELYGDDAAELYADRFLVEQNADEYQDFVDVYHADQLLESENQQHSQDPYSATVKLTQTKANVKPKNADEIRLSDDIVPVGYTRLQRELYATRNMPENPSFHAAKPCYTSKRGFKQDQEVLNVQVTAVQKEQSFSDAVDRVDNARRGKAAVKIPSPEPIESLSTIDFQTEFSARQDENARKIEKMSPVQEFGLLNARRRQDAAEPVKNTISSSFSAGSICNFARTVGNPVASIVESSSQQSDLIQDAALRQKLQISGGSDTDFASTFDQIAMAPFPTYEGGIYRRQVVPVAQKQAKAQPPREFELQPQATKQPPQPAAQQQRQQQLQLIDHFGSSDFSDRRYASALSNSDVELANALFTAAAASRSSQPDGPTRFVAVQKYEPFKIAAHSAGKLGASRQQYSDEQIFHFTGYEAHQIAAPERVLSASFRKIEQQEANSLEIWRAAPAEPASKQPGIGMQSPLVRPVKSEEEQLMATSNMVFRYSKPYIKIFVPVHNQVSSKEQATSVSSSTSQEICAARAEQPWVKRSDYVENARPEVIAKSTSVSRQSDASISLESSCQQIYPNDVVVQNFRAPAEKPEEYPQNSPVRQPIAVLYQKSDFPEQNASYSMASELSSYQDLGVYPQRMIPLRSSVPQISRPSAFVFAKQQQQPLSETYGQAIPQEYLSEVHIGELGVFKKAPDTMRAINLINKPVQTDSVHHPANAEAQTSLLSEASVTPYKETPPENPLQREWQYIQEHLDQYPFFVTRYQLCGKCYLRREQGNDKMVETARIEEPPAAPSLIPQATETAPIEVHDTSVQLSTHSEQEVGQDQEVYVAEKRIVERQLPCLIVQEIQDETAELVDKSVQQSAAVPIELENHSIHSNIVNFVRPQTRMPPRAPERPLIVNEVALVLPAKRVSVREFRPKQVVAPALVESTGLSSQTASSSDSYFYSSYSSATESRSGISESPQQISQISRNAASSRPGEPLRTHSSQIQSVSLSSGPASQTPHGESEAAATQDKSAASEGPPKTAADDKLDWKELIEESLKTKPSDTSSSSTSIGQVYPKVHSSQLMRAEYSFSIGEVHPMREKALASVSSELSDGEVQYKRAALALGLEE